ncbi:putative reverse transcriptase domain-containing protein [Tanacetum coccineum]
MTKLTQKKVKFVWGDKQEAAFQLLKQKLCSAPILALPEGSEDFIAYCDASKKGLGAVLIQRVYSIDHQEDLNQQRRSDVHIRWDKIEESLLNMMQSFCEVVIQQKQTASIDQ